MAPATTTSTSNLGRAMMGARTHLDSLMLSGSGHDGLRGLHSAWLVYRRGYTRGLGIGSEGTQRNGERGVSRQEGIYTHAGALCPHDGIQSRLTREVITGR